MLIKTLNKIFNFTLCEQKSFTFSIKIMCSLSSISIGFNLGIYLYKLIKLVYVLQIQQTNITSKITYFGSLKISLKLEIDFVYNYV